MKIIMNQVRSIFKTVIVGLLIGNGGGTIAAIFRHFGGYNHRHSLTVSKVVPNEPLRNLFPHEVTQLFSDE